MSRTSGESTSRLRREAGRGLSKPMRALSLVLYPDEVLREVCRPVEKFDSSLRDMAEEMLSLMRQHAGIGLAAPQVGHLHRMIVAEIDGRPIALTNLEVKDFSEPRDFTEGCLSLPGLRVNVRRPERIRLIGYDLRGQRRSYGATGLWARVVQHELDHLNGVLICDYNDPITAQRQGCPREIAAELTEGGSRTSSPEQP